MPVLRSERNYPLVLKADALNTGIVAAYDWAAEDGSTTAANGKDHSGNSRHYALIGATPTIVQTANGKGRDTSIGRTVANAYYDAAGATTVGLAVGTGDFSIYKRVRTPTQTPVGTTLRQIGRIADSGGNKIVFQLYEVSATPAWYWQVTFDATNLFLWNDAGNIAMAPSTDTMLHITRTSGTVKFFVNGVLKKTVTGNTTNILGTTGASHTIVGNYTSGHTGVDAVYLDDIYWSRGLSDAEVVAHAANPYSYYDNTVAADTITPTSPATGTTVSAGGFTVAGTYAGGTTVTAVEASFNGGAYVTISASPTGGTFTGTMSGQSAGNGTLTVRSKNGAAVVATSTVSNVTVVADAIAFTVPPTTTNGAVPYRTFHKNSSKQASVRITGTYSGSPTSIQYRWNNSAWTTLVASPTGGTFDQIVTLQGPGQSALEVRFSNSTGIIASMPGIGVGTVKLILGQSNNVGMSLTFKEPVAPAANPTWLSEKLAKDGVWKPHQENSSSPFDDRTNATYSVQVNASTPLGSYLGALATKIMASGEPIAFVPCALGSSSLSQWAISTATTSLYGAALARAAQVGAHDVIWWQGEFEAANTGYTQAEHEAAVGARMEDWYTRTGAMWFIIAINPAVCGPSGAAVNAALLSVGQTHARSAGWADMSGAYSGDIHYDTGAEIDEIANRVYLGMYGSAITAAASWTEGSETTAMTVSLTAPPPGGVGSTGPDIPLTTIMSNALSVGEVGKRLVVSANYNMVNYTALTLEITRPGGAKITRTGTDVTISSAPYVAAGAGTFAGNTYAVYVLKDGDLTVPGEYLVRLQYEDATPHRFRPPGMSFTVSE